MRRSAAPSQLFGNAVKKPRFVPPGASTSHPVAESKPLSPKFGLGNALDKVNTGPHLLVYHPTMFKLAQIINSPLIIPSLLQVQRSLAAPAPIKTGCDVQPKAAQAAPALSRALARVLNASKENEAETENPNTATEECTGDSGAAGKTSRAVYGATPAVVMSMML